MHPKRIGILTSGGDAQGMNAAVRAVVRTALDRRVEVYAIHEGYQGMVDGGDSIRPMTWDSVGGILHRGGTAIGSARCEEFTRREGRLRAARHLVERGIDGLIVIGGDGSLTGADIFRREWSSLLDDLVGQGWASQETADRHRHLSVVGLVGSIDNDMVGTDMTIGADSALHRIVGAVDALASTAASHHRTFVVEVMGRRCGYLALMSGLAAGANWVLIPECPPDVDDWEDKMCQVLKTGRAAGRRHSIVIVAEGAQDRHGKPISSDYVEHVLEERLGEDTRLTVLGHVQRGGSPSAFDRNLSTWMGHAAVDEILSARPESEPVLIGIRDNRITRSPLMQCVEQTRSVARAIAARDFDRAAELRGRSFRESFRILRTLVRSLPHEPASGQGQMRLAILNSGGTAPGMNTAVRAATRLALDQGHTVLGVRNGFQGLVNGELTEMGWMSVTGWAGSGGAELGTNTRVPGGSDFYAIARCIEKQQITGLLVIGGWSGYEGAHRLYSERDKYPAFDIPILCLPATIDNNLPGSELSVGADTALNNIVEAVDKIKQSAVATQRCFVVEVMGRYCGYLALMSGLATGAERVYLHEQGIALRDLLADLDDLTSGFKAGKRLGLLIRNERANDVYTTAFIAALFEEEGGALFQVRQAILGHLQQGGDPTPFDRILATRLAARSIEYLVEHAEGSPAVASFIGLEGGQIQFRSLEDLPRLSDPTYGRPRRQWWMDLCPIASVLAQPAAGVRTGPEACHPQ
jgi:6-phosphofructokinase 1